MARTLAEDKKAALEHLTRYERHLSAEVEALQQELAAVQASLRILTDEKRASGDAVVYTTRGIYTSMPAQDAVELFLRHNPTTAFGASEVARELQRGGFVPRSRNFNSQIGAALNRLTQKGVATRAKRGGVLVYQLVLPPTTSS